MAKNKITKIMALLLSAAMALTSVMPTQVFAADDTSHQTKINTGKSVKKEDQPQQTFDAKTKIKLAAMTLTNNKINVGVMTNWGTEKFDWLQDGHKTRSSIFYDKTTDYAIYCINQGKDYTTDLNNTQSKTSAEAASKIEGLEWLGDKQLEVRLGIILKHGYQATEAQMHSLWDSGDVSLWKYGVTQILVWANAKGYWTNSSKMKDIRNTSLAKLVEDTSVATVKDYWDDIIDNVNEEYSNVMSNPGTSCGTAALYVGTNSAQQEHAAYAGNGVPELFGNVVVQKSASGASEAYVEAYPMTGAEYTIYTDSKATKKLANADVLKIKASGKSQSVELNAGTYYIKETKAPKGWTLDKTIYKVVVQSGATKTVKVTETTDKKKLTIKKTAKTGEFYNQVKDMAAYIDMTATFEVKITDLAGSETTETVKTNAAGEWVSKKTYEAGTKFEITETVAPKNYLLPTKAEDKTKTLTLSLSEDKNTVTFEDACMGDPADLRIRKVDPKYTDIEADKYAEFDVWFYDNMDASGEPMRHWVYRTNEGSVKFDIDSPFSGDPVFTENGGMTFPVGSLKIQEKASPEGYAKASDAWIAKIEQTEPGQAPRFVWVSQSESGLFEYTDPNSVNVVNQRVRGGVKVLKVNAETNEVDVALEGTVIGVYANEEIEDKDNEVTYQKDELVKNIVVDEDGIAKTAERDLPVGKYYVKEVSANQGFQRNDEWKQEFEIESKTEANGVLVDLTGIPLPNKPTQIHTVASDVETEGHVGVADKDVKVSDIVYFENLDDGKSYYLEAKLVDAESGALIAGPNFWNIAIDESGETSGQVSEHLYYTKGSGEITMPAFEIDGSELAGKTVVVTETLYELPSMTPIIIHDALDDENQSVHYVEVKTTAKDGSTGTHAGLPKEDATIVDTVELKNLIPDEEYTVRGKLMKSDGTPFTTEDGQEITQEKTFTADDADMTVELTFNLDASKLDGTDLVVFEKLFYKEVEVARHEDKDDEGQTVHYPGVRTTASDKESGTHTGIIGTTAVIVDEVVLSGLIPGEEYTVRGTLMNSDGTEFTDADGNTITQEQDVTATESEMTIEMVFELDSSELGGKSLVVFEKLFWGDAEAARHEDKDDKGQTVNYPAIRTMAYGNGAKDAGDVAVVEKEAIIKDHVMLTNLTVGEEYIVSGKLMKADGSELPASEYKTEPVKFIAEEADTEVVVEFKLDSTKLQGETLVVFEKLAQTVEVEGEQKEVEIAVHEDIEDTFQTVHYPEIGTTLIDNETQDHISYADESVKLTDTVEYRNLTPGTYVVKGILMDKATKEAIKDDEGKEISAQTELEIKEDDDADGTVEVVFEFKGAKLAGKTVVAFESLYKNDVELAVHADIEDEDQTVAFPEIRTKASNTKDGTNTVKAGGKVKIVDKVSYKNLLPGKKYVVKGVLMNKKTGKPLEIKGKDKKTVTVTAEADFKTKKADGTVEVVFELDTSSIKEADLVVFEKVYISKPHEKEQLIEVGRHEDINDKDQTIKVTENPKTGDTTNVTPYVLLMTIATCALLAIAIGIRKRKENRM